MGILLLALCFSCVRSKPALSVDEADARKTEPVTPAEPVSPEVGEAPTKKPAQEAQPETVEKPHSSTVYIDPEGDDRPQTQSLIEASRAEKARRAKASEPVAVITNKNLSQFNKGKVTIVDPKVGSEKDPGAAALSQEEEKWRKRGLDIRLRWKEASERVRQLELDTAGWRRRFYAENDASIRDRQIKPEWDRTLDELRQARIAVETAQKDLTAFLEEGRAAGALPGWLREGAELEPPPPPASPGPTDAIAPPIAEIDPRS